MNELQIFGTLPDGTVVHRVAISGGGLTAHFLSYGAVLQDLRMAGHGPSLVLGFETLDGYLGQSTYFGSTVGRCANRICEGRFTLDGKDYQLDHEGQGPHHLHGGSVGIDKRVWRIEELGSDRLTLAIDLEDGEMGYPGNMAIRQTITLQDDGVLDIAMEARTDAPTLCNLAHHGYFNLDGGETILDHEMEIAAEAYLPVDEGLIPTGEIAPVMGDIYDFRQAKPLRPVCLARPIDHNFCLSNESHAISHAATLRSPASGISMEIRTTEPGLQIFDSTPIDIDTPGIDGRVMRAHCGIAMEPQCWPDAINHPGFPQAVLRPSDVWRQHTQFIFTRTPKE